MLRRCLEQPGLLFPDLVSRMVPEELSPIHEMSAREQDAETRCDVAPGSMLDLQVIAAQRLRCSWSVAMAKGGGELALVVALE